MPRRGVAAGSNNRGLARERERWLLLDAFDPIATFCLGPI
jgi:hypothetical protein